MHELQRKNPQELLLKIDKELHKAMEKYETNNVVILKKVGKIAVMFQFMCENDLRIDKPTIPYVVKETLENEINYLLNEYHKKQENKK